MPAPMRLTVYSLLSDLFLTEVDKTTLKKPKLEGGWVLIEILIIILVVVGLIIAWMLIRESKK
jgi:hypothetical protein